MSLSHYDVDVYAGGEPIPEGELWIRRNCIRLKKKPVAGEASSSSAAPFYLFTENCSEKEDFYHALLHNQEQERGLSPRPPTPQLFHTDHMIKLIRQLHTSEETAQLRWLNAIIGRLFLGLYQTSVVENFIQAKIAKKMARVSKPAFITSLKMKELDMGDCAPIFTSAKVREMTVDGALTVEADVKYNGNFKLVIAAVARIELGSRFKPREVNMILAGILQKLEGHILFKFKPPPSNRIWVSFETMPKLDILLEPIVSSRQITYGIILRAIENRLREVVAETLVLPNWDDIPFTNTQSIPFRGGIWKIGDESEPHKTSSMDEESRYEDVEDDSRPVIDSDMPSSMKPITNALSSPDLIDTSIPDMSPVVACCPSPPNASRDHGIPTHSSSYTPADKPKSMRSNSFAVAASPVISKSPATIESIRHQAKKGQMDAAGAMKTLSSRSPDTSPIGSPGKDRPTFLQNQKRRTSSASRGASVSQSDSEGKEKPVAGSLEAYKIGPNISEDGNETSVASRSSSNKSSNMTHVEGVSNGNTGQSRFLTDKNKSINQSLGSATAAAKNWGLGMIQRQQALSSIGPGGRRENDVGSQPIGRGQPLPPPGQPLPRPERDTWPTVALNSFRRKPVPPPTSSQPSLLAAERATMADASSDLPSEGLESETPERGSGSLGAPKLDGTQEERDTSSTNDVMKQPLETSTSSSTTDLIEGGEPSEDDPNQRNRAENWSSEI